MTGLAKHRFRKGFDDMACQNRSRKAFRLQGLPTKVQKSLVDGKRAGESCHVFTQNVKAGGGGDFDTSGNCGGITVTVITV